MGCSPSRSRSGSSATGPGWVDRSKCSSTPWYHRAPTITMTPTRRSCSARPESPMTRPPWMTFTCRVVPARTSSCTSRVLHRGSGRSSTSASSWGARTPSGLLTSDEADRGVAGGDAVVTPPLLVIAGATATGKTGLSLDLARALRDDGIAAEVISADSRQVYRGLDIGTAKVPLGDRAGIPHHGLDLVAPDEPFSVADYVRHARGTLAGIAERGGVAILVGGT